MSTIYDDPFGLGALAPSLAPSRQQHAKPRGIAPVWPDEVPILVAGDLVRRGHSGRTLSDWLRVAFYSGTLHPWKDVSDPAEVALIFASKLLRKVADESGMNHNVTGYTDQLVDYYGQAECARIWNMMLVQLGYEIPEPLLRKKQKLED
jgi:hypothetical protein